MKRYFASLLLAVGLTFGAAVYGDGSGFAKPGACNGDAGGYSRPVAEGEDSGADKCKGRRSLQES